MANNVVIIRRPKSATKTDLERTVEKMVSEIRNGNVTLVLQDGIVIQINRTESIRIDRNAPEQCTGSNTFKPAGATAERVGALLAAP